MEGLLPLPGRTLPPPAHDMVARRVLAPSAPQGGHDPPASQHQASWLSDPQALLSEVREAAWPEGPVCPRCKSTVVIRYGTRNGVQRYRCKDCFRCFTDLTGTVLQGIRRRDKWLDFCACMASGLTVRAAAAEVGICKNTSFAWRHKIISRLAASDSTATLGGIVELAQSKVIKCYKGSEPPPDAMPYECHTPGLQRQWSRSPISPGAPRSRIAYLLFAIDRTGKARADVLSYTDNPDFSPAVMAMVSEDATICVARGPGIWPGTGDRKPRLSWVSRSRSRLSRVDESAEGPLYHVSNVKRLLLEYNRWELRFRGVATKYLLRYVSWFWRVYSMDGMHAPAAARRLLFDVIRAGSRETGESSGEMRLAQMG